MVCNTAVRTIPSWCAALYKSGVQVRSISSATTAVETLWDLTSGYEDWLVLIDRILGHIVDLERNNSTWLLLDTEPYFTQQQSDEKQEIFLLAI